MPKINAQVTINASVGDVFRYAIGDMKAWQPDIEAMDMTDDRIRQGISITQRRSTFMMSWRLDLNADITDYKPNKLLEYKGVLGRFPVLGQLEFTSQGGTTLVVETLNIKMPFITGLYAPFMRRVMTNRTQKALNTLKSQLETGGKSVIQ
ncbi:MAG TPA: SRPBCC family protein [Aggregatilineales bacterium]|nr:SRPBCC family protein [Aggregatilineales bacterium]